MDVCEHGGRGEGQGITQGRMNDKQTFNHVAKRILYTRPKYMLSMSQSKQG